SVPSPYRPRTCCAAPSESRRSSSQPPPRPSPAESSCNRGCSRGEQTSCAGRGEVGGGVVLSTTPPTRNPTAPRLAGHGDPLRLDRLDLRQVHSPRAGL